MTGSEANLFDIEQWKRDRNEALLSLDRAKIEAYMTKYGVSTPTAGLPDNVFWGSIHKAITACKDLPREFRLKSKQWLAERGWHSLDDGDLA